VAEIFAAMPTVAVGHTKRLLDAAETNTFEQQLELEAVTQAELVGSPDFKEGVAAFLEKREPHFTGVEALPPHPIRIVVTDDLQRWRLTVAIRWLLGLPHLIMLGLWTYLALAVWIVNWVIALVRGRPSERLHGWTARFVRYQVHVNAYLYFVADPYPSFRGWPGTYPVDLLVGPSGAQPRWKTLLRLILVLPAYVLMTVLVYVLYIVAFFGAIFALATARYPKGMRDLSAYTLRYQAQTFAYLLLLTDRYPTLASGTGYQFEKGAT
jgi:Domain of unknown function (DUF4389)